MKNNITIIQELYSAFAAGNGKTIANILDENIIWEQQEGFPNGGKHRGAQAVFKNVFAKFADDWSNWKGVGEQFMQANDQVIVTGYYSGTALKSGKSMKVPMCHIYTLKNGKAIHFKQFTDTYIIQETLRND
jgi:ketosteroid isomerase-like protein